MNRKTTFQTKAVKFANLARAFEKEGFQRLPTGSSVPSEIIRDIMDANPEIRSSVVSGSAEFAPLEYGAWTNGEDFIDSTDWEVREPERITTDPFVRCFEAVPGRTSSIVKRILETQLQIDFTTYALSRGPKSRYAKQCIQDLASIKGRNPQQLYNQYLNVFLSCWVDAIAAPKPVRRQYAKSARQKIPVRAIAV